MLQCFILFVTFGEQKMNVKFFPRYKAYKYDTNYNI